VKKHVALTGFMAAGKSTIASKLARKLQVPFYDVDDRIVRGHGAISDIFYAQGEAAFREFEFETIQGIVESEAPGIIALGGGAVTHDATLKLLKKRTYRVFIKVPPEQLLGRLRRSKRVRPLVGPTPSLARIKELYMQRLPRYAHADFVVEADDLSTSVIVDRIAEWLARKNITLE
jgi:shikimate kinase